TKRMFWNSWRPGQQERDSLLKVDVGEYNPVLGTSYTEIAALSRSMHKTQGFGASGRRGMRFEYFKLVDGEAATDDIFDGINTTWGRVDGGTKIGDMIQKIITAFDPGKPAESVPGLLTVYRELGKFIDDPWCEVKRHEVARLIQSCAGLWVEAIAGDYAAAPGDDLQLRTTVLNRSDIPFKLDKISVGTMVLDSPVGSALPYNEPVSGDYTFAIPSNSTISQPYWLEKTPSPGLFSISDHRLIGMAENKPSVSIIFTLKSGDTTIDYDVPLLYRWTDRARGELYRPFEIRPPVTVNIDEKVVVFSDNGVRKIPVRVKSNSPGVTGEIMLNGSQGWTVTPQSIPFSLEDKFAETQVVFQVSPPSNQQEAKLVAGAKVNGETYTRSLVEISHPHIKSQVYFPESGIKTVKIDMKQPEGSIGYIEGSGDIIPECLRNLGYAVVLLDDEMLGQADLAQFDAIITGIRAYNTRERLIHTQPRLMEYVEDGGTLIVQYNVSRGLLTSEIGPYPFTIGRDRVTVEEAPVTFLDERHQLLNYPNKITAPDFDGWIQERGLYFATQWDDRYDTVLSSHDPNEPGRHGGLLFARHGKGVFIYTGFSWFRQLPAGIPGAYKLFVNLISAGKFDGK
ncbi:hypothetical protein ACFL47_10945, partial [Candidatus Latescibacterota bacterium]